MTLDVLYNYRTNIDLFNLGRRILFTNSIPTHFLLDGRAKRAISSYLRIYKKGLCVCNHDSDQTLVLI